MSPRNIVAFRPLYRGCGIACAALLIAQAVAAHAEALYHFIDEHGVPHFSNQPLDPRYRLLGAEEPSTARSSAATQAQVSITAPEQATLGEMFDVSLSISQPPAGAGYLELSFDPEVIALQAISVDASITEPGKVHIDLNLQPGQAGQTLANLSFQAVAPAPTEAGLQVSQLELANSKGEVLPIQSGAWTNVHLVK
jgi:hypothetical protein